MKEVHAWSKLDHPNVLPLIGITTQFDLTVSIISPWVEKGNARDHLRDESVDPRPLVRCRYFKRTLVSKCCIDPRDCKWAELPA